MNCPASLASCAPACRPAIRVRRGWAVWLVVLLALALPALAQRLGKPAAFKGIDIEEHLGAQVPLDLTFRDETGAPVTLRELCDGRRPVALVLAYYQCPMLCTFVLNGLTRAINETPLRPGEQYQLVTVSIDPREGAELATAKRTAYLGGLTTPVEPAAWRFLTADQATIDQLADTLGFRYFYDAEQNQYAHPAVVHVLTPEGKISRYLYGIQYQPRDFRLALLEASEGRIGNIVDRVLLYCFHYSPRDKEYTASAMRIMRLGGATVLAALVIFLAILWRREGRRQELPQPRL
jgi:protein SCO1/2